MKVLIIYATNSGSTELVAKQIKQVLDSNNHQTTLQHARDVNFFILSQYEYILIGTPSWDFDGKEGQPHEDVIAMLDRFKGTDFSKNKFALFGCGDRSYAYFCEGIENVENFVKDHKGNVITPTLKIDGYFFDIENNNKAAVEWAQKLGVALK
jgi:flavodoxin I